MNSTMGPTLRSSRLTASLTVLLLVAGTVACEANPNPPIEPTPGNSLSPKCVRLVEMFEVASADLDAARGTPREDQLAEVYQRAASMASKAGCLLS